MQVGDTVFLKPTGNAVRYYTDDILKGIMEDEIVKIATKYFYLKKYSQYKFYINGMHSYDDGNNSGYIAYLSMQEIYNEQEAEVLGNDIRKVFGSYGKLKLSLDKLRRIKSIIEE